MTISLPVVAAQCADSCLADGAVVPGQRDTNVGTVKAEPRFGRSALQAAWARFEKAQAYRHERAEWTLYFLAVTGLILWSGFSAPWPLVRWSMLVHIIAGVVLFPPVVMAFWMAHRSLLRRSRKRRLRVTGRILEAVLVLMTLSGFYLVVYGNPGNMLGEWMHMIHLWLTVFLLPLLLWHAFRWSVLRRRGAG